MSCNCNDVERAKVSRVHEVRTKGTTSNHTGTDIATGVVIDNILLDAMSICEGGTGVINEITIIEYNTTASSLTKKDQKLILTSKDLDLVAGDTLVYTEIEPNYEHLVAIVDLDNLEWSEEVTDTLAVIRKQDININYKVPDLEYHLFGYLVTDELQTIHANTKYTIKFSITKD